ncbi:MAG: UDP-2,3-diacylglucosamine diphosphatase LpxI [Verrucomicrobiota bacterium]
MPKTVGIIAGNGVYPPTFAKAARKAGVEKLVAAGFTGETDAGLEELVDATSWFRVGQLSKMIQFFQSEGVTQAVMVGQIAPRNLFDLRPDMRTLMLLGKLKEKNAESIFRGIAGELEKDGITLLPATTFLDDHLAPAGHICGPKPEKQILRDAEFGLRIAKEVSALDIGQTVVVRNGTVLAVEAFEGTNEAIRRGGKIGKGKAVLVKVSKPDQDMRFDVPVIGPATLETAAEAGLKGIVIEAGRTLILGREEIEAIATESGIAVVGVG